MATYQPRPHPTDENSRHDDRYLTEAETASLVGGVVIDVDAAEAAIVTIQNDLATLTGDVDGIEASVPDVYIQDGEPLDANTGDFWVDTDAAAPTTIAEIIDSELVPIEAAVARVESRVFDVRTYGATGDGTTNDRAAIQAAIDAAVAAGGGTVLFPWGVYKIEITTATTDTSPASDGEHGLVIDGDNITLKGEPGAVLDCYVYGGDPDTHWDVVGGEVWRGGGIFVTGGADYATRRRNVRIEGLEINGNFTFTGDHSWPADPSDGSGWDITHKGIWFENDLYHDDHAVINCHLHHFSGEVIYSGGADTGETPVLGRFTVEYNTVHDTNGSAISVSGRWVSVAQNTIHTAAGNGIENVYEWGRHDIHHNRVYATSLDCISVSADNEGPGSSDLYSNRLGPSATYGIALPSGWNVSSHDNTIIDCVSGGYRIEISGTYNSTIRNIEICGETILADTGNVAEGMYLGVPGNLADDISIHDNLIGRTPAAVTGGFAVGQPFSPDSIVGIDAYTIRNNHYVGTHGDTSLSQCHDSLLTASGNQYPVQFKSPVPGMLLVSVSVRVITGATTVGIKIHDGSAYVATVLAPTSLAVGSYSYPSYLVRVPARANASLEVNAGTANQVYVTSTIREA